MIEFKNLNKTFHLKKGYHQALQNINLTVHKGEIFGILGESGAGKSTLLRCANLLTVPDSGQVIINGTDLTKLTLPQLKLARRNIGMIFQQFNLLQSRTAFENIALPLELEGKSKTAIQSTVSKLLELVNLSIQAHHYPTQLSGGQQQRVAIARALATKPSILLCDEATSALDAKSTAAILKLLKDINQKLQVTILLITHEMNVIKQICDRAGVLHQGNLIEHSPVIDLFANPRSQITRTLVQKALHLELPESYQKELHTQPVAGKSRLVRFTFVGDDSSQPLITTLVQKFNITVNIIQANIEHIQSTRVGFTICQLTGEHSAVDQALAYIQPSSITAEVLGYV